MLKAEKIETAKELFIVKRLQRYNPVVLGMHHLQNVQIHKDFKKNEGYVVMADPDQYYSSIRLFFNTLDEALEEVDDILLTERDFEDSGTSWNYAYFRSQEPYVLP